MPASTFFPLRMQSLYLHACLPLLLVSGLLLLGCDRAPGPVAVESEPPRVSNLDYAPERVILADPDAETIDVPLQLLAEARPGSAPLDRVVFSFLSSVSGLGATGTLDSLNAPFYGINALFELPADPDQYTVRVFAIDADSLQSNVTLGQLRIVPDTTATP